METETDEINLKVRDLLNISRQSTETHLCDMDQLSLITSRARYLCTLLDSFQGKTGTSPAEVSLSISRIKKEIPDKRGK